jgi:hypothetical protein
MMALNRVNKMGMKYYLEELSTGNTRVKSLDLMKEIVVEHSIQRMSQGWYEWTMEGESIQDAFSFLDAGEREFLMTGILDDEWNELFREEE